MNIQIFGFYRLTFEIITMRLDFIVGNTYTFIVYSYFDN